MIYAGYKNIICSSQRCSYNRHSLYMSTVFELSVLISGTTVPLCSTRRPQGVTIRTLLNDCPLKVLAFPSWDRD